MVQALHERRLFGLAGSDILFKAFCHCMAAECTDNDILRNARIADFSLRRSIYFHDRVLRDDVQVSEITNAVPAAIMIWVIINVPDNFSCRNTNDKSAPIKGAFE